MRIMAAAAGIVTLITGSVSASTRNEEPGRLVPRTVVVSSSIVVLRPMSFRRGSAAIPFDALPMLEAVAATLTANDTLDLEIVGQVARGEPEARRLSLRRAAAVRGVLVARGVAPARLTLRPAASLLGQASPPGVELYLRHDRD